HLLHVPEERSCCRCRQWRLFRSMIRPAQARAIVTCGLQGREKPCPFPCGASVRQLTRELRRLPRADDTDSRSALPIKETKVHEGDSQCALEILFCAPSCPSWLSLVNRAFQIQQN